MSGGEVRRRRGLGLAGKVVIAILAGVLLGFACTRDSCLPSF